MRLYKITGYMLCLCGTALLFEACGHSDKKEDATSTTDTALTTPTEHLVNENTELRGWFQNPGLQEWSKKMKKEDTSFSVTHFSKTDKEAISQQPDASYSVEEWKAFEPHLVYSPDHLHAIDLYSYGNIPSLRPNGTYSLEGGDPDSEVSLVNVKTRKKRRLLFVGPGTIFQQAAWINDSMILVTGESDANAENEKKPVMWRINLNDSSLNAYQYQSGPDSTL